jgi:peptidoglycan/LPS O-acetylase OafA/YrhL
VLLVLGRHIRWIDPHTPDTLKSCLSAWQWSGWMGVDLFFVLSGFLVSGLVFREYESYGSFDAKRFLIRRGFKIYPAYYLLLLVAGWFIFSHPEEYSLTSILYLGSFTQNYYMGAFPFLHTWSLAVEEHFYICIALAAAFFASRKSVHLLPWLAVAVALFSLVARAFAYGDGFRVEMLTRMTHLRMDGLAIGLLFAYFYNKHPEAIASLCSKHWKLLCALAVILPLPCAILGYTNFWTFTIGITAMYFGWVSLLILALHSWSERNVLVKAAATIGFYSYSIYVWHVLVERSTQVILPWIHLGPVWCNEVCRTGIYIVASVLVGIVMARLVEIPFLALRERLVPARPKARASEQQVSDASKEKEAANETESSNELLPV